MSKKKKQTVTMKRFHATLPVSLDGPVVAPTPVPVVILATSLKEAKAQARKAGLTVIGPVEET